LRDDPHIPIGIGTGSGEIGAADIDRIIIMTSRLNSSSISAKRPLVTENNELFENMNWD